MKISWRRLAAAILTVLCLCWCGAAWADRASYVNALQQYRGASKASNTRYGKYTRGYWDKALAEEYNGLAVAQNPEGYTRYLSNRGCRLFTFVHAVQLLTGEKASADRQLELLAEFLRVDDDPPNAKENYAAYLVQAYGPKHGVKQVSVAQTWSDMKAHFDQGGVIVFNSGGHIALAVDCTEREIGGQTEQLVLLIDSACEATARRVVSGVCYNGSFTKTYVKSKNVKPTWNEYGRLWIRYSDFVQGTWQACFTSTTAKNLAGRKVEHLDDQARIAVTTAQTGILNGPYEGASAVRTAEAGEAIRCTGAVVDKDGTIWYATEDGRYLCEHDAKAYPYDALCDVAGVFTAPSAERRIAPGSDAPVLGVLQGDRATSTCFVTDGDGDIWAHLTDGSYVRFYDLSADRTELIFAELTEGFVLSGVQAPAEDLKQGGKFPLRGVISAEAPILSVEAVILNRETAQPALPMVKVLPDNLASGVNVNADVNGTNINSSLTFGALKKGWYTYVVSVQLGLTYEGRTVCIGEAQTVIESSFTVGSPEGEPVLPETTRLPGDADEDGEVVLSDALLILQYDAGERVSINSSNADVNGDGGADVNDALRILQYVAGWNVTLL